MNIEEFVNYYLQNYRHEVLLNPYNGLIEFAKVFQEKLMEEAVDGHITQDSLMNLIAVSNTVKGYNFGDEVRMLVLPKED